MQAATGEAFVIEKISKINAVIVNPLIYLLFLLAFAWFLYGVTKFVLNADSSEGRKDGQQHIMYAMVGFVIMFGVFGLVRFIGSAVSAKNEAKKFDELRNR